MRKTVVVLAVLAAMAAFSTAGYSGKGNGKNTTSSMASSTITLNQDPSTLSLGSLVSFTTNAVGIPSNAQTLVDVSCSKGTTLVWAAADSPDHVFKLGGDSSLWLTTGGGASCVATLIAVTVKGDALALATKSFLVS